MNEAKEAKEKYAFEVDGMDVPTGDDELDGRQVRSLSGHDPAADWRLIEIHDRYTTSVGLEEPVLLERGAKRVFRCFEGDRDYDFLVEDRGWEWGAPSISEADVRAIARIAKDRDLVVVTVGGGEHAVPRGGTIDLSGKGVERIYSRKAAPPGPKPVHLTFVINGEPVGVTGKPDDRLVSLLEAALKESENTGQEVDAWQVTDEPGNPLDVTRTVAELGLTDGAVLLASLRAGAAG